MNLTVNIIVECFNYRNQRGKMATPTELFQEAERLIQKTAINEAIDLLNRLGKELNVRIVLLHIE